MRIMVDRIVEMKKLADISSFENLGSSVVPVFNFNAKMISYECDEDGEWGEVELNVEFNSFADIELACRDSRKWETVLEYIPVDDLRKREKEFFDKMESLVKENPDTPLQTIFDEAMDDGLLVELGWMDEDEFNHDDDDDWDDGEMDDDEATDDDDDDWDDEE